MFSLAAAVPVQVEAATLDVDGNNSTEASTDGLLIMRYLFKIRGATLVQDALGSGATRTSSTEIESYLSGLGNTLDVDGNGRKDALTDGLLIYRYLLGMRGNALIQGALGPGATRATSAQIENYIAPLAAGAQPIPPSACTLNASPASGPLSRLAPNTPVQLTANCGQGDQPINYNWEFGSFSGPVRNVVASATKSFFVTASNAGGSAPMLRRTVFVAEAQGPGYCYPNDNIVDVPWPTSGQIKLASSGFLDQVVTFKITIPTTFNPPLNITHVGTVRVAEVPGRPAITREVTVSHSACDFHSPPGGYLYDDLGQQNGSGFIFTVNNPSGYQSVGANVNFSSGEIVYVSVRNYSYNGGNPAPTCPGSAVDCDIFWDFSTPNRN